MRKKIIAGNWKMHMGPNAAVTFANAIKTAVDTDKVDVVFCVPYVDLTAVSAALAGTKIAVGAQNMHFEDSGAYTGEIAAPMLTEMGIRYVIIGHSERREYFNETDLTVNKKIHKALANDMIPIVCVGESLAERDANQTFDKVRVQTLAAFENVPADAASCIVVAYEPIWAIGTGRTATKEQAEEVCAYIRGVLAEKYGAAISEAIRIQYGGSVNAQNAAELFKMPNIDGGLVGGASIKPEFERIVHFE